MNITIGEHTEPRWAGLREVGFMAGPIVLGMMSHTVMQFVDTAMVANWRPEALGAIGSAGLWVYILSTFLLGVVGCVSTFVSQCIGRDEKEHCAKYAWQGIYLSFVAGALSLLLWPLAGPLFRSMPHSETVTNYEITYFQVRIFGYLFLAWGAALAAYFQAIGRPMVPMGIAIFSNILNVGLDYVLIFGIGPFPEWGIYGAAVATVIGQFVFVAIAQMIFWNARSHREFGTRTAYAFDAHRMRELFRIGWPSGLTFLLEITTWGIFTSWVIGRFGDLALASHTAALTVMHMSFILGVGLNHAIAPIVGNWIGKGHPDVAIARTYTALKIAIAYMTMMGIVFALFGYDIIYILFGRSHEIAAMGYKLLLLAAVFQAFDAITLVSEGALRGAGDTRWMAVVMGIASYFGFLPLALLLTWVAGLEVLAEWTGGLEAVGAWVGATVYIIVVSGLMFYRFYCQKWRHMSIFLKTETTPPAEATPTLKPAQESAKD
jgi:MATE family multidrug resistance protein